MADEGKPGDREKTGQKILLKLNGGDYSTLFLQTDGAQKIESMTGTFRDERRKTFRDIGEIARAPVHNSVMIAWDVLHDRKHTRVIATGADEKASTLKIMRIKHRDPAKGWFPSKQD